MKFKPEGVSAAKYTALMGLLFAVSAALNWLESLFSAFLPLGMRVGLSNIVIMLAILCVNLPSSILLVILKSGFVFMTRGVTAGLLSLCGGLFAFGVTALLFGKTRASYIMISVLGALAHSLGQLTAASLIMGTAMVFGYSPVLIISSTAAGIVTGVVLKVIFPIMEVRLTNGAKRRH